MDYAGLSCWSGGGARPEQGRIRNRSVCGLLDSTNKPAAGVVLVVLVVLMVWRG